MITRLDNLFKSCLQRYFDDTDNAVDYVSKPIWEFNENDYLSGNPIMFLALPLDFKTEDSKSGARTDSYMIELYFFRQGNINHPQENRTPRVDEMKLLCDKVIDEYLGTSEGVELGRTRRVTDVYNFNDSNLDGVRIILDFEFTYNCLEEVNPLVTGDSLILFDTFEPETNEWHAWKYNNRERYSHIIHDHEMDLGQAYWPLDADKYTEGDDYLLEMRLIKLSSGTIKISLFGVDYIPEDIEATTISKAFTATSENTIYIDPRKASTGASENFYGYIVDLSLKKVV